MLSRRTVIKRIVTLGTYGLSFSYGIFQPVLARMPWNKMAFSTQSYQQVITDLFGEVDWVDGRKSIKLSRLPRIAENGAVVPITVDCEIEQVSDIYILVKDNPFPLIAHFSLSAAMIPRVSARLKMAKTSEVVVVVQAHGQFYHYSQRVKVAKGGCG